MLNKTIQETIAFYTTSQEQKKINSNLQLLCVESFIDQLQYDQYTKEDLSTIEILCKKIDVTKKLYTLYDIKSFKPQSVKEISSQHFNLLCCHLVGTWFSKKSFKCINTALKMNASIMKNSDLQLTENSKILIHMVTKNVFSNT